MLRNNDIAAEYFKDSCKYNYKVNFNLLRNAMD